MLLSRYLVLLSHSLVLLSRYFVSFVARVQYTVEIGQFMKVVPMNRPLVKSEFICLTDELLSVRSGLSLEIRRQTKSIILMEKRIKRLKRSVIRLKRKKEKVGDNLNRVSKIRNQLAFVTNEPHQPKIEWESDDAIDSDALSDDSPSESEDEKSEQVDRVPYMHIWLCDNASLYEAWSILPSVGSSGCRFIYQSVMHF